MATGYNNNYIYKHRYVCGMQSQGVQQTSINILNNIWLTVSIHKANFQDRNERSKHHSNESS